MEIKIIEAPAQSLDAYISVVEEAAEWLWHKGVKQWKPRVHRKNHEKLSNLVEHGYLILAYQGSILVGGCILSEVVPKMWSEGSRALYLNGLVVTRPAAGQGVGGKILNGCINVCQTRRKTFLRLDCWDGNEFLKTYYKQEGFEMLDAVREKDYWVRLFEKRVE
jgi:GNAT superfamily N-acetyltransferase